MRLTRDTLLRLLEDEGVSATTYTHPPVFTVEESNALKLDIPGAHIKNLFLKDEKGALFLVVAHHDTAINLKQLWRDLGCKRLSFGRPELLWDVLAVRPGSVTPLALLNAQGGAITFVWDGALDGYDLIAAHPLENTASTVMPRTQLLALLDRYGHAAVRLPESACATG
ncbi:MAG: prolyl-tRNA synthetase associated domain-containing protein [Proteobacteria bacterium]|nr:prolyl-tRNA synthetase associated domain-containing protein [Pseudomonadota bacterium]